jgi:hypothetical protein
MVSRENLVRDSSAVWRLFSTCCSRDVELSDVPRYSKSKNVIGRQRNLGLGKTLITDSYVLLA